MPGFLLYVGIMLLSMATTLPAAEPDHQLRLVLLSQTGKEKDRFWHGEPIRFRLLLTTRGQGAVRLRLLGSQHPLFPLGEGLRFKRKDGMTFRLMLTPQWHHRPEEVIWEAGAAKPAISDFLFPDYESMAGQRQVRVVKVDTKKEAAEKDNSTYAQREAFFQSGLGLLPPGEYEVTYVHVAWSLPADGKEPRGLQPELPKVELQTQAIKLMVQE